MYIYPVFRERHFYMSRICIWSRLIGFPCQGIANILKKYASYSVLIRLYVCLGRLAFIGQDYEKISVKKPNRNFFSFTRFNVSPVKGKERNTTMNKKTTNTTTTTNTTKQAQDTATSLYNVKPVYTSYDEKGDTCNMLSIGFSGKITGKSIKDEARATWPGLVKNASLNEIISKAKQFGILKNAIAYATVEKIFMERGKATKAANKTDIAIFNRDLERKTWDTKAHMAHVLAVTEFDKLCTVDELNRSRAFENLYNTYVLYIQGRKSEDDLFTEYYKYFSLFGVQLTNRAKEQILKISGMKAKNGNMTEMAVVSKSQYMKDTTAYFFTVAYNAIVENNLKNDVMKIVVAKTRAVIDNYSFIVVLPNDTMKTKEHVDKYIDSILGTTVNTGKGEELRKSKAISVIRYDREKVNPKF